jgi:ABC-2 type transport system permease protein
MAFGYLGQVAGVFLCLLPYPYAGAQFSFGMLCLILGLLFLLAFLRNETDEGLRRLGQFVIGGLGVVMALIGLVGGNLPANFLVPYGLMLAVLGLIYLIIFVGSRGTNDDLAYRTGVGTGLVGAIVFLVAFIQVLARSDSISYFVPTGLVLLLLGVLYVASALLLCSDRSLAVLTRRELGAFFYSPVAYIVLFLCVILYGWPYMQFVSRLVNGNVAVPEPIIAPFILQWTPVIFTIFVVPALTMRLVSEERRSGTLEVLLTAPVGEPTVTLSKFLAAFIMYALTWLPVGIYLAFLWKDGGRPFDYRPLLSFFIAQAVIGAGFISMGLFWSSLTRNQIASFMATAVAMVILTMIFFVRGQLSDPRSGPWAALISHTSYIDVWINTLDGKLQPTYLVFFGSLTVLWLFLTAKALEARKWAA